MTAVPGWLRATLSGDLVEYPDELQRIEVAFGNGAQAPVIKRVEGGVGAWRSSSATRRHGLPTMLHADGTPRIKGLD